jgi:hypothetical protein
MNDPTYGGDVLAALAFDNGDVKYRLAQGFGDLKLTETEHSAAIRDTVTSAADSLKDSITAQNIQGIQQANTNYIGLADRLSAHNTATQDAFSRSADLAYANAAENARTHAQQMLHAAGNAAENARTHTQQLLYAAQNADAAALAAANNATDTALAAANLSREILVDGARTRELMQAIKTDDLRFDLTNARVNEAILLNDRVWGDRWNDFGRSQNANLAAISSNLNAIASDVQQARQGVVNFGSMTGNAGRQQSSQNVV